MSTAARPRILISACLLGERVRHDGGDRRLSDARLERWRAEGRLLPVCPEVAGGLGVPRPAAEIDGAGDGAGVLNGTARIVSAAGADLTGRFVHGAQQALALAQSAQARLAILTDRSPSCGSAWIHDGSFSGVLRAGRGVTCALLEAHGIRVFSQHQLAAAADWLQHLENGAAATQESE